MDTQTDCYVAGALAVMLRASRIGGIAPLKFTKKGSGWKVSFSPGWSCYGYFIVTIFIVATIGNMIADYRLEPDQSVRLRFKSSTFFAMIVGNAASVLLIAATSVFGAANQMRALITCMNRIEKINCELNIRHCPMLRERKNTYIFFIWKSAAVALFILDFLMLLKDGVHMNQIQICISVLYSFYYCCCCILLLRTMNFTMITLHVMYCLRGINDKLKILLRELIDDNELLFMTLFKNKLCEVTKNIAFASTNKITNSDTVHSGTQKTARHHETVRRLALAYAKTCDVVRDVNDTHGIVVVMTLGSSLMLLVCTPYYIISYMLKDNQTAEVNWTTKLILVGVQLLWLSYHTTNLLMIIEPCHMTHMEMETTCKLVSHLMCCTDSSHDPLAMELKIFFKHLILNRASYSAMHITTISRSLIARIVGSITTYLVIMIQL